MKKFDNRTELFKEILNEIYNMELLYSEQMSNLNTRIQALIKDHSTKFSSGIAKSSSNNQTIDPFNDRLISEGVQNLIAFYLTKYGIVKKEASELKIKIESLMNVKLSNNENIDQVKEEIKKFDTNLNKLEKNKKEYDNVMNKLENQIFFYEKEKRESNLKGKTNQEIKEIKKKLKINDQLIEEAKNAKEKYIKSLELINTNKKDFLNKVNIVNNEIKEFNVHENHALLDVLEIFQRNLALLSTSISEFQSIFENNKNSIEKQIIDIGQKLFNDSKINLDYNFLEYEPKHKNLEEKVDVLTLFEMNKIMGFQIEDCFTEPKEKNEIKFLMIMEKLIKDSSSLTNFETEFLKNEFNDKEKIKKFLLKLNLNRSKNVLLKNKEAFELVSDLFFYILAKLSFETNEDHLLIKSCLILSQTFYYKDEDNNKKFIDSKISSYNEFQNENFWKIFLSTEIESDIDKEENINKKNQTIFITFLSNLNNLKYFLSSQTKIIEIVNYFKDKYKFNEDNIKIINEQLGFSII